MFGMAEGTPEAIKEKIDIAEFLKGYLALQPAGKNYKALCPFHREKTPSFMVSPERQSWHCFGCALGGDIFSFLMRYENIEFSEALKILAERAGIELRRAHPADYKFFGLLYELNDAAKEFFKRQLSSSSEAREYLKERKLVEETIREFELGWAPPASETLMLHLMNLGYAPQDIVRAGLAIKSERGAQFDRFRGRIMFPIHNHFGKVAGFTGRILPKFDDASAGKYVNSPESPIFNKSKLLYGFWKTKNEIRSARSVFLVEGQMDMLMSYQAGVRNAVATSGTALTGDHLRVLGRIADELVISFDNDEAGQAAGERAIDAAEANDFNVRVLVMQGYKDPGEAAEKDPGQFREAVQTAVRAPEFYFERYLPRKAAGAPFSRNDLSGIRSVLGKLKLIPSPVERGEWLKTLSRRTGLSEKVLAEEMERFEVKVAEQSASEAAEVPPAKKFSRSEVLSQHLLAAALAQGDLDSIAASAHYMPPEYRAVYRLFSLGKRSSPDKAEDELMELIVLQATGEGPDVESLVRYLAGEYVKQRREELAAIIRRAEDEGNEVAVRSALDELSRLSECSPR